jgi:hypothetical protein
LLPVVYYPLSVVSIARPLVCSESRQNHESDRPIELLSVHFEMDLFIGSSLSEWLEIHQSAA